MLTSNFDFLHNSALNNQSLRTFCYGGKAIFTRLAYHTTCDLLAVFHSIVQIHSNQCTTRKQKKMKNCILSSLQQMYTFILLHIYHVVAHIWEWKHVIFVVYQVSSTVFRSNWVPECFTAFSCVLYVKKRNIHLHLAIEEFLWSEDPCSFLSYLFVDWLVHSKILS